MAEVERVVRGWPSASAASAITADPVSGLDIVFGDTGNAALATRAGWSAPEPGSVWSVGQRSVMVLPASGGGTLLIELAPFTDPVRLASQRIAIRANGTHVAAFDLMDHSVLSVPMPADAVQPGEQLTLTFETPDAARPTDITGFGDDRVLAFSFRRLLLKPGPAGTLSVFQPPAIPAEVQALAPGDLLSRFESLGENCEFGLVQRRCGIDPLGLLRFASAPLPKLRAALRARFAGMGEPDTIDVQLSADGQEYMVHDRVFGFNYHAWIKAGEEGREAILAREARRVPFLVRKLLEDLESGEKIFVFHGMQPLTPESAADLKADLGRYGPGTLLWVEQADAGRKPGSVEWVAPGLLRGAIDQFAPGEDAHELSLECWLRLCGTALAAVEAAVSGTAADLAADAASPP